MKRMYDKDNIVKDVNEAIEEGKIEVDSQTPLYNNNILIYKNQDEYVGLLSANIISIHEIKSKEDLIHYLEDGKLQAFSGTITNQGTVTHMIVCYITYDPDEETITAIGKKSEVDEQMEVDITNFFYNFNSFNIYLDI